jgi:hypothetical protein
MDMPFRSMVNGLGVVSPPPAPVPAVMPVRVSIIDVDMPFRSMVTLMVKWAFASVPAMIVVFAIVFTMFMIAGLLFGGLATALLSSLR